MKSKNMILLIILLILSCSPIKDGFITGFERISLVYSGEVIDKKYIPDQSHYDYKKVCDEDNNCYKERYWHSVPEEFHIEIKACDLITNKYYSNWLKISKTEYYLLDIGDIREYEEIPEYKMLIEKIVKEKVVKGWIYVNLEQAKQYKIGEYYE